VYARPYASRLKLLDEPCPVDPQRFEVQLDGVKVPGSLPVGFDERRDHPFKGGERLGIQGGDLFPHAPHPFQFSELRKAEGGFDVRNIVFVAPLHHFVEPGTIPGVPFPAVLAYAVQPQSLYSLRPVFVIGCGHTAFAGRKGLRGVETEARNIADGTYFLSPVPGGQRVGGVLDHVDPVFSREFHDLFHVTGLTREMDGDDRPGPGGNPFFYFIDVYIVGLPFNVSQHRARAEIGDHLTGGGKRHGGEDNLIPRLHIDSLEGKMEGGGSRIEGNRVGRAYVLPEPFLKFDGFGAHGEPPRFETISNLPYLVFRDVGLVKGDLHHVTFS